MTSNQLLTTGELAERTGYERTTIHRKISELGIKPVMVAGRTRLFSAAAIDAIGIRPTEAQS